MYIASVYIYAYIYTYVYTYICIYTHRSTYVYIVYSFVRSQYLHHTDELLFKKECIKEMDRKCDDIYIDYYRRYGSYGFIMNELFSPPFL